MLYLTKPYSTLKLGREVDERAYAIWLGEPRNDSIDWFPSVKANDILCVGRSGYFLKQGIFIYNMTAVSISSIPSQNSLVFGNRTSGSKVMLDSSIEIYS
jgi:hypothetical protein